MADTKCIACGETHDPKNVCDDMKEMRRQSAAINQSMFGKPKKRRRGKR